MKFGEQIRGVVTVFAFVGAMTATAHSQSLRWMVGVSEGVARGVNEDKSPATEPIFRFEGVSFSTEIPAVSPGVGISTFTLTSKDASSPYYYTTRIVAPDIRARISPYHTPSWFPYVNLGFGVVFYDVTTKPRIIGAGAKTTSSTVFFPLGAGMFHRLTERLACDINVSNSLSLTDDINPVHDDQYDAWWTATASLYFAF